MHTAELVERWRSRAEELAPYAPAAAEAFRRAAAELEDDARSMLNDIVTLADAARESGYSADSLRHMVAKGQIPNAGKRGAPRIRRADLPRRAGRPANEQSYDAGADALSIVRRGKAS